MIDERKLIAKLENWAKESKEESGLKEPALLKKIIEEIKAMAVNEEIKARIERESTKESKLIDELARVGVLKNELESEFLANAESISQEKLEKADRQPAVGSVWIPVSERLPEDNKEVLVTISDSSENYTSCDWHNPDGGERWDVSYGDNVVAWMPLPEPYREEVTK